MAKLQLSDGRPDGVSLGQNSTDLVSVYGVTPVAQAATQDAVLSTVISAAATNTTSNWGFATSTQANALVDIVEDLRTTVDAITTAVKNFGIMAAS